MDKVCEHCKKRKKLAEFFQHDSAASSNAQGTSRFCIECHHAGFIEHGYGGKFKSPADVVDCLNKGELNARRQFRLETTAR